MYLRDVSHGSSRNPMDESQGLASQWLRAIGASERHGARVRTRAGGEFSKCHLPTSRGQVSGTGLMSLSPSREKLE